MFKSILMFVLVALSMALYCLANCGPGMVFVPDGGQYCSWYDGQFFCDPTGYCESACYPSECADLKPTATTKIRTSHGKKLVTRYVVHTERKLTPAAHLWILKDPDTKKFIAVPVPVKGQVGPKLTTRIKLLESALTEQIQHQN